MSSCCSNNPVEQQETPQRARPRPCTACGQRAMPVGANVLLHHLQSPWQQEVLENSWWVCEHKDCQQVYFNDEQAFCTHQLRDLPAGKLTGEQALVCFCFGVARAESREPAIREFVVQMTRAGQCDCEIRNPAGHCCLKDFPKP